MQRLNTLHAENLFECAFISICADFKRRNGRIVMFVIAFNAAKKKRMAYLFLLLIFVIAAVLGIMYFLQGNTQPTAAPDNASRIAFLESFGWRAINEPVEVKSVAIPNKFNDVYEEYNEIQKAQNFDLSKYRGEKCYRYSYKITNYPNADETSEIIANILIKDGIVIGGDICSLELNGFMHGFTMEKKE